MDLEQLKSEKFTLDYLKKELSELGIELNTDEPQTNFDMLVKTIYDLRNSQGGYSRLWITLCTIDSFALHELMNEFNSFEKFNDTIDVILYLEG